MIINDAFHRRRFGTTQLFATMICFYGDRKKEDSSEKYKNKNKKLRGIVNDDSDQGDFQTINKYGWMGRGMWG